MNHLIAKVKNNRSLLKVWSDENKEVFNFPKYDSVDYSPEYKLEEDEWFKISQFSHQEFCLEFLKESFNSTGYNSISEEQFIDIQYLCAVQNRMYFFQKMGKRHFIKKKFLSMKCTISDSEQLVVINDLADAVYDSDNDIFYFKKLETISSIFKGIDALYKEATDDEVEEFVNNDFLVLGSNYGTDKIKKQNRKRIALVLPKLATLLSDETQKRDILNYINEYSDLEFDESINSFYIENEIDLKNLLFGIEERFYTTDIGGEKRLANSIKTLED